MSKLRINLDVLNSTINEYGKHVNNFREAQVKVRNALKALRASGWDTAAGNCWFSMVNDDWLDSMEKEIDVIEEMIKELQIANREYSNVISEQEKLISALN